MEDLRLLGDERQAVRHTQVLPLHRIDTGFRRFWTDSLCHGSETIHLRIRKLLHCGRLLDQGIEFESKQCYLTRVCLQRLRVNYAPISKGLPVQVTTSHLKLTLLNHSPLKVSTMKLRSGTSNEAETEKEFTQSRISTQTVYHMLDCTTLRAQQTSCGIISTSVC